MHLYTTFINCLLLLVYYNHVLVHLDIIIVHDSAPSPVNDWWIKRLRLSRRDCDILWDGKELTDSLINACQHLLSKQYPNVVGFEDTALGYCLQFTLRSSAQNGIQILHTGMHSKHLVCQCVR